LTASAAALAAASTGYYFQDLGSIDGLNSGWEGLGYAINDAGQVTGITGTGGSGDAAFLYGNAAASLLDQGLGGFGYGINAGGAVAGCVNTAVFPNPPQQGAAMWTSAGVMNYIGMLPGAPSYGMSYAYGISDTDQVVGRSATAGAVTAFYWTQSGGIVSLGTLPGSSGESSAVAIDSATGQIVGSAVDSNGVSQCVFFDYKNPGTVTQLANMPPAGAVVNDSMAINDNDWVVADDTYLWEPTGGGTVINLEDKLIAAGYPVTSMNVRCAINNQGVVAMGANESTGTNAFLYDAVSDTVTSLNNATFLGSAPPPGFMLSSACGINDAGQVTGWGTNSSGQLRAFLLTPTLPGDANLDGKVDINDLTIVLAHYGQTGVTWTTGEFTGDGTVDINDLTIVLAHYGQSLGASAGGGNISAVPEPAALASLAAGFLALLAHSLFQRSRQESIDEARCRRRDRSRILLTGCGFPDRSSGRRVGEIRKKARCPMIV
jgi:probable HAF family extracellular repeat protein